VFGVVRGLKIHVHLRWENIERRTSNVITGRMPATPVSPGEACIRLLSALRLLAADFSIKTLRKAVDGFPGEAYKYRRFDGLE
jgi:hypothetical protein